MTALAPVLQAFFTQHLAQRRVSPHTIASYRDTFRLLLRFTQARTGKTPAALHLADLDAELVSAFLDHLEADRHNGIETRNLRLTAIHSMFSYAAMQCPEQAELIRRVLAIPSKRPNVTIVSFLAPAEATALLGAPDRSTAIGRRDHALLLSAIQTGLRVSELTALRCRDITLGTGANAYTMGKGRRERHTPLTPATARLLRAWLHERRVEPEDPVFATRSGGHLSTDAVEDLNRQLRKAIKTKGSFPNEDAARKLVYLALQNAVPQWTRTRNWTTALLAFKIHFGDRVPDTAN